MKQEVIQDFLNLPGIAGVALMDGRSRPYFCGVDQTLNFQQREALAQGILQVVETIPEGFQSFEFQFTGHQVHIYKLAHGIILLVLTGKELVYADYLKTIKDLKAALQEDIANAIATFRLIAGNITLSGMSYHRQGSSKAPIDRSEVVTRSDNSLPAPAALPLPSPIAVSEAANSELVGSNRLASSSAERLDAVTLEAVTLETATLEAATLEPVTLKDALLALNQLSRFTTQYLGTQVIVNYWKVTRPNQDWLDQFQVDRSAQISVVEPLTPNLQQPLSLQEQQWLRAWVATFIQRGSQVIRDFPTLIDQSRLSAADKKILFG